MEVYFKDGYIEYTKDEIIERDDDLPAVEYEDGTKIWFKNGKRHRNNDKPALISLNKYEWWKDGKLHRDNDLPAVISPDQLIWYKNGKIHREGILPAIIYKNGYCEYRKEGILRNDLKN